MMDLTTRVMRFFAAVFAVVMVVCLLLTIVQLGLGVELFTVGFGTWRGSPATPGALAAGLVYYVLDRLVTERMGGAR